MAIHLAQTPAGWLCMGQAPIDRYITGESGNLGFILGHLT
jgi:hypothetical protein